MRARPEIAAGTDEPAAVFIGMVRSETDRNRVQIALRALQSVEYTFGYLGEQPGVALSKGAVFRGRNLWGHLVFLGSQDYSAIGGLLREVNNTRGN